MTKYEKGKRMIPRRACYRWDGQTKWRTKNCGATCEFYRKTPSEELCGWGATSKYIQENFSFVVLPVKNKEKRLKLESKPISTISSCKECKPSEKWLGINCPNEKL